MSSIGVLGAGTWGIALARMLSNSGHRVTVWSALEKEIDLLSASRTHPNLPGMQIPQEIQFTKSVETACTDVDIILFAVPSVFVRSTAAAARPYIRRGQIIVDVAKGIEAETLFTMTEVIWDELRKEGAMARSSWLPFPGRPTRKKLPWICLPPLFRPVMTTRSLSLCRMCLPAAVCGFTRTSM